jgi:hypothetical protein
VNHESGVGFSFLDRGDHGVEIHLDRLESIKEEVKKYLEDSFDEVKSKDVKIKVDTMQGVWSGFSD